MHVIAHTHPIWCSYCMHSYFSVHTQRDNKYLAISLDTTKIYSQCYPNNSNSFSPNRNRTASGRLTTNSLKIVYKIHTYTVICLFDVTPFYCRPFCKLIMQEFSIRTCILRSDLNKCFKNSMLASKRRYTFYRKKFTVKNENTVCFGGLVENWTLSRSGLSLM